MVFLIFMFLFSIFSTFSIPTIIICKKMKNERIIFQFVFHLISINLINCQRSSGSSHRSDVYIAGFFPYGEGVENSQTGKNFIVFIFKEKRKLTFYKRINNLYRGRVLELQYEIPFSLTFLFFVEY